MQIAAETPMFQSLHRAALSDSSAEIPQSRLSQYKVIRRNGAVVGFEPSNISVALTRAFLAVNGGQGAASVRAADRQ